MSAVGASLDHENCKCRKRLVDKLIDEFSKNIDKKNLDGITTVEYKCSSCMTYIVLMIVAIITCFGIVAYLVYYNWSLIKMFSSIKFFTRKETII